MPATTQRDATLTVTLTKGGAPLEFSCQVISAEFTPASNAEGEIVPTACGDTVVEPGDPQAGSLTGEVFKDTGPTGITRALLKAIETGEVFDYVYAENPGSPLELRYTGKATVPAFGVPFTPSRNGRHPLALTIGTSVLADPVAPVAAAGDTADDV